MSHEIYYTSAPRGLRPGQQGFCTVAATSGIPKPLWDRLESVSGYRHPFGASPGRSPVAWAHWLVQSGGRDVSVLSRVCDAGMDYTQRTNSFAHHIALEPEERAAGGPAWMLQRPGLMKAAWDGQVGPIQRTTPLPRGDAGPIPCAAWQKIAGDAGWGGALAETAVRGAHRPVCILLSPGLDPLPLIAEAIALLPERVRWQVTFSTYFTSLPGAAVCAWRCCLAGSPAARETLRHAAGSLVLDLSAPGALGPAPEGAWADAARTGRPGPASAGPAFTRVNPHATRAPAAPTAASPADEPPALPDIADLAPGRARLLAAKLAEPPASGVEASGSARLLSGRWRGSRLGPRRLWVAALCGLALLLVGVGTWLRLGVTPPIPAATQPTAGAGGAVADSQPTPADAPPSAFGDAPSWAPATTQPAWPTPPATEPTMAGTRPVLPGAGAPGAGSPRTAPPRRAPATVAALTPAAQPTTAPTPTPPTPPTTPDIETIELAQEVPTYGQLGRGIRDPVAVIAIKPGKIEDANRVESLQLSFPGDKAQWPSHDPQLPGQLIAKPAPGDAMRQIIAWQDANNASPPLQVVSLTLDLQRRRRPVLRVSWHQSAVLRRPEVCALARELLGQSVLRSADAHARPIEAFRFKTPAPIVANLESANGALKGPAPPPATAVRVESGLPAEWEMSAEREGAPGADAGWTLHFKCAASATRVACEFAVHLSPGWTSVRSDFAQQQEIFRSALREATAQLGQVDDDLASARQAADPTLATLKKELADATAAAGQSDAALEEQGTTRQQALQRVEAARSAIAEREARMRTDLSGILTRKQNAEHSRAIFAGAVAAFNDVRDIDLAVESGGGVKSATLRLARPAPADAASGTRAEQHP